MIVLFKRLQLVLAILAGTALFAMMVLTFVDVIGRYGFNHSIFGTAELIRYLMVVVVFAGVAFVSTGNQHIRLDIFDPVIHRIAPNAQRWAILVISLLIYAFFTWELATYAIQSFVSGRTTAVLELPQWFMPAFAALFSLGGVVLVALAICLTRGRPEKLDHDFAERPEDDATVY